MSQEDTDATTSIKEADSSSENTDFILMETIDDPPPAVENPTSEVSQTSSTSSEASLSNIGPEKDIKDESNKITDSPKRVKLIRPEFDKEKLAQKIREIEEREKLKLLNKLKEEELAKSEEKPAEDSSQNKTEDDKQHDNVAVDGAGKLKASETLDSKVVAESNTEMQIEEKSVANPLGGKSSKVEERLKEDGVSQQDQEPTMDTGAKFIEESKVSTSEGDSKLDAKPEMADKNIVCDSKAIPATTGLGLEKQKQDINLGTDDLNAKLVESAKKLESDDQVSSTGVAELNPSVLQKETKITEALKKDNVEQKFELKQQISVPKEQVEANIVKDADNSQIKAGINIADDSFIEKCGNDSLSKDVTDTHKPVGNIEKKLEEQKTTDSECKNTGLEKVTSEVIESGTCAASSSKAVDNEKKKEGAAKIGSEEKGESPSVTTGKIRKIAKENETESISRKEKQEEECSLTKSVTDGVQKSKIEKIREEIMESKSKVDFPKHVETVEKLDLAETSEKELKNKEEHSRKIDLGGNVEIVDSPNINVQNSIESVLDELTVEPSRSTEKKIENPGRFGMDTASKCQELSSIKLVDESSNKSEDILMEIEKFIDSSAEKAVGRLDGKDSEEKLKMTTLKTEEKSFDKLEAIERNVTDVKNMEKLASESKIVFSHLGSEKSATKRKSDDEVGNEDTKRKHSFEYAKSYENDNKEIHDSKNIDVGEEKLVIEKDSKNSDKSKQTPEFDLEAAEKENKEEIIVPTGGKDSDDIPSSKDSKDDNDETSPETPPLEKILDSIIGSETEPAEIPEEELVISDVPSTALVESKIPESPRRVKLVRPSKPATKTLTKPETTKQITQSKPVEQKLPSEINVETYVSVKAVEKSSTEKSYDIRDTKKADKEEAKALNISKPSDKPIEFENKLSVLNETDVKIDSVKAVEVVESSTEVKLPTKETTTLQLDEKLTTEKDISVKTQSFVESSIIKPQQTEKEISVVKTASEKQIPVKVIISGETSTVEAPQELKEKTAEFSKRTEQAYKSLSDKPNQPEETIISTKNLSKDFSERLPSQPKEKITGNESEQVDTAPSLNLKESSSVENPQSIQSIVPEKVVHSAVKSGDETVDKSFPEKPVAPTKITPTIATPNLSEVITPKPIPEPIRSEVATTKSFPSEVNTLKTTSSEEAIPKPVPSEVAAPKVTPEKFVKEAVVTKELKETLTAVSKVTEAVSPVKSNVSLSSPEKSPSTSGESETAKLRRIIRKPRHERMAANETKLAEGVTSSTALQSAKGDESKLVLSGAKEQTSENLDTGVKKVSQENIFLDMTVDEEDDDSSSKEGVVTNSEKKDIETKQLGFKLKIAKSSTTIIPKEDKSLSQSHTVAPILSEKLKPQKPTEHTFGSITISATTSISREKHQTDMRKVEEMLKDTDVTITPLVDRDPTQKLSKITLKIGKDGNPPEIKQMGESWSKQLDAKRKPSEPDDGGSPSRKKIKDESAVLTTSAGVEIDLHMTKPKLLSSMIAEPPLTTQDPRLMMTPQQMTGQTAQQTMGLTAQQMMSQLTPQQANIFLGTPQSQMFQGTPATPGGSEVVKKKRGRPRKIPLAEGQQPQDQKLQALKQQEMMHSQQGSSGTGTSSGSDEYSSGVFPQVPLFDMTESLFDQPHLFPNQVKPMRGRPQRSCRGRIKLPSVRTRKPRGSTVAARASTGRGRGRGYKRQFTESDNIITLENVKEEMRRQSLEQAQFMGPMEVSLAPHLPPEPAVTPGPSTGVIPAPGDHVQGAMKSPERKPRKRKNEEEERERIEKIKQRREEKKMKTLEKKRKIAEAKAKEKAAVMAAALVEEETRMSAPERKEEEKKKDAKTEKKIEGETDVSLVEEPSQPDSIRVEEPEEVSQQSLETKEPVQFAKELIEAHEPSTPVSKPDLIDVSTASCDGPIKVEPSSFQDIKKESSSTNTETVEPLFVTPKKEKKVYRCLICREDSPLKKLTSPLDHRSWRVLYQAAIVRGHEEIINLTKNLSDEIPTGILYHRNCRSEFTHKKTLAKLTDCPIPEDNQPIAVKTPGAENINPNTPKEVIMDGSITEYQWPLQGGELYMIQEQVSDFLEITSFKRKYPDIARRTVDPEERVYLRENGLVSEAHCDLGLIAVKSSDVLDIMFSDFQDKYEEFRKHIRDKQARELSMKNKAAFTSLLMDKRRFENRVLDAKTEAMQAVAAWNSRLNKTRGEQRRCMLDLQSMIVHYPRTVGVKRSQVPNPPSKVGHYPVALVPGQFCDNYKRYNPNELKYFPLNTVIYGPMKPNERHGGGSDGSQTDSDDSSSSDDSSDTSSESSQDSDASGDESNDKDMKERQPSGETHCKVCGGDKTRNKQDNPEVLINCAQCTKSSQLLQLNRLPTVLLSNCSNLNVRNTIKTSQTSPSLSKLLKPAVSSSSQSPIKKLKTENGSIGTVTHADSPRPIMIQPARVQMTQGIKLQETQNARTLQTQSFKVVPGSPMVRTQETQSFKVVQGSPVVRTQETQSFKVVQGSPVVRTQETQSFKVVQGTPVVKTQQETQSFKVAQGAVKTEETQSFKVVQGTQLVDSQVAQIKVEEAQEIQSVGTQEAQNIKGETFGVQRVEVQATQNADIQESKTVEAQKTQSTEVQEIQSNEVKNTQTITGQESSQSVEVLKPQTIEVQESSVEVQETQSIKVEETQSIRVEQAQSAVVQDPQAIEVQEPQNVEVQETQIDEKSQNDEGQESLSVRAFPGQVVNSDSNTSNSTNSIVQSNTICSTDSVDKADTVSSTVDVVESEKV